MFLPPDSSGLETDTQCSLICRHLQIISLGRCRKNLVASTAGKRGEEELGS